MRFLQIKLCIGSVPLSIGIAIKVPATAHISMQRNQFGIRLLLLDLVQRKK
jgi:hypothetical protein